VQRRPSRCDHSTTGYSVGLHLSHRWMPPPGPGVRAASLLVGPSAASRSARPAGVPSAEPLLHRDRPGAAVAVRGQPAREITRSSRRDTQARSAAAWSRARSPSRGVRVRRNRPCRGWHVMNSPHAGTPGQRHLRVVRPARGQSCRRRPPGDLNIRSRQSRGAPAPASVIPRIARWNYAWRVRVGPGRQGEWPCRRSCPGRGPNRGRGGTSRGHRLEQTFPLPRSATRTGRGRGPARPALGVSSGGSGARPPRAHTAVRPPPLGRHQPARSRKHGSLQ